MVRELNEIAKVNLKKYGKPPTWEQIDEFIKSTGIKSIYHFEQYYGISYKHLAKVKCGLKNLGRAYWHIFYEKINLPFGVGKEGVYENLYNLNTLPKNTLHLTPKKSRPNRTLKSSHLAELL